MNSLIILGSPAIVSFVIMALVITADTYRGYTGALRTLWSIGR